MGVIHDDQDLSEHSYPIWPVDHQPGNSTRAASRDDGTAIQSRPR